MIATYHQNVSHTSTFCHHLQGSIKKSVLQVSVKNESKSISGNEYK